MNNQNNFNNFDGNGHDENQNQKNNGLPEEIKLPQKESVGIPKKDPKKRNQVGVNRALYVTAIILLLSVAIIAAVTSAANRSRKNPLETPFQSGTPSTPNGTTNLPSESNPESTPPVESSGKTEDVSGKIPSFKLPVSGKLAVDHDPELQVFSPTMQEYRVHLGIDINTAEGAAVYSAAGGKVTKIWNDAMMGWCIEITHDGKACTYYKNLSETLAEGIKVGADVSEGQLLGAVGESAMMEIAQEPHLHFEMTVDGKLVDPMDYFASDVIADLGQDENYEG